MPRRLVNLVLLAAVATLLASGVVAWLVAVDAAAPLYLVHRVAGVALVLAAAWKYGIARRSLRRRPATGGDVVLGIVTAVAAVAAAGIGVAWTVGIVSYDRPFAYSAMSLHVVAGLSLGALVVAHALVRGEHRPALVDLVGRRSAIKGLGLLAASIAVTTALDGVALAKRATGSRLAGSFSGNAMPTTIWAFDDVPTVAVDAWRLEVSGSVERPGSRTLADLAALPRTTASAVLDCTGGWWSEQVWSGVRVADLLAAHGVARDATRVEVISVTGHSWSFGREEAERALLATHVGGETISPGHGYPVRLVVPDRRGFTWIKWVRAVRVA